MKHLVSILLALVLSLLAVPAHGQDSELSPTNVEAFERWTPRTLEEMRAVEAASLEVVKNVRQTVVAIRIRSASGGWISGSGTIISENGLIATAAHVVGKVGTKCLVYLADGSRYDGKSLGLSHAYDLALIQITNDVTDLPFASIGHSSKVGVGQWVVSMGHPLGPMFEPLRPPVIRTSRVREVSATQMVIDGSFAPGDSGGPTFNLRGQLIGVNVSIRIGDPYRNNCAPINNLRYNLERLARGEALTEYKNAWEREFDSLLVQGYKLAGLKKWEESRERFNKAIALDMGRPEGYYHLACLYFRWYGAVGDRDSDPDLLDLGLSQFEMSVLLGFSDLKHILSDPDVNKVRNQPRFRKALRTLQRRMGFRAYLGVRVVEQEGKLIVTKLTTNSPAQRAGLRLGDQLLQIGDMPILDFKQFRESIQSGRAGDVILLTVRRGSENLVMSIQLAARGAILDSLPEPDLRSGVSILRQFKSQTKNLIDSMVVFLVDGKQVGYGPIVRSDGYLLGKHSEIGDEDVKLTVRLADGSEHEAKIVAWQQETDLALVKIQAAELSVVAFPSDSDTHDGSFALAVGAGELPLALGSISVEHFYDMPNEARAFLGIAGRGPPVSLLNELELKEGVLVVGFEGIAPAAMQGIRVGDLIVAIDGSSIASMEDILLMVRNAVPKETKFVITLYREGEKKELEVTVGVHTRGFGWGNSMTAIRIRGPFNQRCAGFGEVIHHDLVLAPSQMGSLLLDIDGAILGINIARYGRCKTLAIPADRVRRIIDDMFYAIEQSEEGESDSGEDF